MENWDTAGLSLIHIWMQQVIGFITYVSGELLNQIGTFLIGKQQTNKKPHHNKQTPPKTKTNKTTQTKQTWIRKVRIAIPARVLHPLAHYPFLIREP